MSSKGLPGFLRRTRRRDFEESEDEDYFSSDDDESPPPSVTAENNNADESADKNQSNGSSSKSKGDEKEVLAEQGEDEDEFVAPIETETEVKTLEKARSSLNEHLPVEDSTSSLGMSSLGSPRPIKSSYRDSKFDSIIGAETIKMADLRMLGWNGIPVRRAAQWIWAWFNLVLPSNGSYLPYSHLFFVSFFFGSMSIVVWRGKSCSVIFRLMPVDETVP
jgi:hypothetical protein